MHKREYAAVIFDGKSVTITIGDNKRGAYYDRRTENL